MGPELQGPAVHGDGPNGLVRDASSASNSPFSRPGALDLESGGPIASSGWRCAASGRDGYSYHSCRNRHRPKCHTDQTARWLKRQRARLPDCPYFLLTFTLPAELRRLARSNQKLLYGLLMSATSQALLKLTADPRYVGGRPGCLAVLHTWTPPLRGDPSRVPWKKEMA